MGKLDVKSWVECRRKDRDRAQAQCRCFRVIFLSSSHRVRRAAAAAGRWPHIEKELIEVLAVQPWAWTLIDTEAKELGCEVQFRNSRKINISKV